jgi:hypothetical protein
MLKGSTGKQTYNLNGQKVLSTGYTIISNDNATDTMTVNCGASVVNVTGGYAQINYAGTGRMILNMATSAWTVAGNWYLGPNIVNNTGTSTVTLSAASTITSNGTKTAYDMIFTGTNKKTFADAPTFDGDLTATTGRVVWSGYNFTTAGDVTFDGTDSLRMGLSLIGNGTAQTFHIGSTVGVCSTAACTIGTSSSCALTLDDDKGRSFPKLRQDNAASVMTLTGTGTSGFATSRLSGDVVVNNTGKDTLNNFSADSVTVTTGDLSFSGLDSMRLYFGVQAGKIDFTGDTIMTGGPVSITVSDSLKANNGTYFTHYGNNDSVIFKTGGTYSTAGMNYRSSSTGSVLRCNKALTIDTLTIDANKNLTYYGNGSNDQLVLSGATPQIILGNSATLTIRNRIAFTHTASCTPWSLGSGYMIDGTDGFYYRANGTGLTATWPAIILSGAGATRITISGLSGNTINLAGNLSLANGLLTILPATAGTLTFNTAGYNITAKNLYVGSTGAGEIGSIRLSSGTHSIGNLFGNTYITNLCSLYCDTSTINVTDTGFNTARSALVLVPMSGRINFTSTTARPHLTLREELMPTCSLANGATIDSGATFARLLLPHSGNDTLTMSYGDTFNISTLANNDLAGSAATSAGRNYIRSSIADTACSSRVIFGFLNNDSTTQNYTDWTNIGISDTTYILGTGLRAKGGYRCP